MAVIFGRPFMLYVMFEPSSPMVCCVWVCEQTSQKNPLPLSAWITLFHRKPPSDSDDATILFREICKHCVFAELLQMVPGLEERLVQGDDNDILAVADLVCVK